MPILEKRYAEALVDISIEKNEIDVYQKDLGTVAGLYRTMPEFKEYLLNPETDIKTKKTVLAKVFKNNVRDEVLSLVLLLVDKARIKYLYGIYEEFVKLADEKRRMLSIKISSAAKLDDTQIRQICDKFRTMYKATGVKYDVEIDESLIGGVKVEIGDKLYDGTVKGMLKNLQDKLVK